MAHDTERLGDLLDSLLPVLVERLHETGLGEIEIERDGATVRVRAFPARFSQLQPEIKGVAPALGEHTQTVAAEIRG